MRNHIATLIQFAFIYVKECKLPFCDLDFWHGNIENTTNDKKSNFRFNKKQALFEIKITIFVWGFLYVYISFFVYILTLH